jgi:ribosome-associated toxin RatA of RatAB toxin-antitoxin module
MGAVKFSEAITIEADTECVFDYTQDYTKRLLWDTFLVRADLVEGATEAGRGIKAYCVARNGLGMETVYVSFNRPRVTAIKMTKGPYLFKSFLGSWTFKPINDQKTKVVFLYSFSLRFPFNLLSPIIRTNLQHNVRRRLLDLKHTIESDIPTK